MKIVIADNTDGARIRNLVENHAGYDFVPMNWANIHPWWLAARKNGTIIGAVQVCPSKPMGRLEHMAIDRSLDHRARSIVWRELSLAGLATLMQAGCSAAEFFVPNEYGAYKRLLKKRGAKVTASGNFMLKAL